MTNPVPVYAFAPELAALTMLTQAVNVVAELLDDLHPEVLHGRAHPTVPALHDALAECDRSIDAFRAQVLAVLREQESRLLSDEGAPDDDNVF